jgi:hypothetical protein
MITFNKLSQFALTSWAITIPSSFIYEYSRRIHREKYFNKNFGYDYIDKKSYVQIPNPKYNPDRCIYCNATDDNPYDCRLSQSPLGLLAHDDWNPINIKVIDEDKKIKAKKRMKDFKLYLGVIDAERVFISKSFFNGVCWFAAPLILIIDDQEDIHIKKFDDFELDYEKWKLKRKIDKLPDKKHAQYAKKALSHKHKSKKINMFKIYQLSGGKN